MDREEEQALVRRARAGDRAALEALVRSQQGPLRGFLLRLCGRAEIADDVAQEALYRALKHLHRYNDSWRFSTWLFTIARRVYWHRQERTRASEHRRAVDRARDVAPVWRVVGWAEEERESASRTRGALDQALGSLPPAQREVMVMFHTLGWSVKMIAQATRTPEGTVKSHLHRARAKMRAVMLQNAEGWDAQAWRHAGDGRDGGGGDSDGEQRGLGGQA